MKEQLKRLNEMPRKEFIDKFVKIGLGVALLSLMSPSVFGTVWFRDEEQNMYSLSQETPSYLTIVANTQAEGNLNLSDATNWNVDKSNIRTIISNSNSTDYSLTLYSKDDFTSDEIVLAEHLSGKEVLKIELPYYDKDDSKEVHIKYTDVNGTDTVDLEIRGTRLV